MGPVNSVSHTLAIFPLNDPFLAKADFVVSFVLDNSSNSGIFPISEHCLLESLGYQVNEGMVPLPYIIIHCAYVVKLRLKYFAYDGKTNFCQMSKVLTALQSK